MKGIKRIMSLLLVVVISIGMFVACGEKKEEVSEKIIVTDHLGREVKIEKIPERIASSYYISTSLLVNLGASDKLVAIEGKAKTREIYKRAAKELLELPSIGNSKNINVEECLNLKADLVVIPTRLKDFIPQFEKLNIPVVAIEPETLEGFIDTINIVSKAVGKEEKGKELIEYYNNTIKKVEGILDGVKEKKKVYLGGSDTILKTCTSKMYQNYLIETCGGTNVTSNLTDGYWANISVEELIKYNPEKIFIVQYGNYTVDDVLKDKRLEGIDAVKNKEVYIFPSKLEAWDFPTPSSSLGLLWLLNNLHPELYSKEEFKKDAVEFYEKFYGIEVSEEEIGL